MEDPVALPSVFGRWLRHEWLAVALVALVSAIYGARLGALPICGEESRWASAAREMIASGDFVVPRQQGAIFPERPPLGTWAMAALAAVRGQVDVVAVRLPSVLATLALVLVIYAYARTWLSPLSSFAAGVIYASGGQAMQLGRLGESDALFALFTAASLLLWHRGYVLGRSPTGTWCLGYALAALGSLVKGPQAPVYFVAVCTSYLALVRDWRWLFSRAHAAGLALFAAIVGAWLVPFAVFDWQAVDDIWAGLASDRFTTDGLARHLFTYPFETFGCLLPWSPLLLAWLKPAVARRLAAAPQARFLLWALAVTYPTVWLAAGARGRYYLPLYPGLALLMAVVVEHCTAEAASLADRMMWRRYLRGMVLVVLAGAAAVVAGTLGVKPLAVAAQPLLFLAAWVPLAVTTAGLLAWASLGENRPRPQVALLVLGAFLGLSYTGTVINARVRAANDLAPQVADLKEKLEGGQLVSLGRVYHRFAYAYETPIRQIPWPLSAGDLPAEVTYFCFDRRPGDTPELRSAGDGRLESTTPGTLPFEWEEVAEIECDPFRRAVHDRNVVVGRVRRTPRIANGASAANPPGRRR